MKTPLPNYRDLNGDEIALTSLAADERELIDRLIDRSQSHPDWNEFDNFWMAEVARYSQTHSLSQPEARRTACYRIAQDLSSRLAIAGGYARLPDYRDELEDLIRSRFQTRREFCQATGLSEDMLSHVLAKRKQLGIETLATALSRIGYELKIVPIQVEARELVVK
jgi:hypothetical protein